MADDDVRIDLWVCGGRVCRSHGADGVDAACRVAAAHTPSLRVLRGGCYGLCDLGANVVARVDGSGVALDVDADRLTLRNNASEHVACGVTAADVDELVSTLATARTVPARMSRAVREQTQAPKSPIEERMRALRARRAASAASAPSSASTTSTTSASTTSASTTSASTASSPKDEPA